MKEDIEDKYLRELIRTELKEKAPDTMLGQVLYEIQLKKDLRPVNSISLFPIWLWLIIIFSGLAFMVLVIQGGLIWPIESSKYLSIPKFPEMPSALFDHLKDFDLKLVMIVFLGFTVQFWVMRRYFFSRFS